MSAAGEGLDPSPLASTSTVSLVEVHPSTVIALNDAADRLLECLVQDRCVDGGVRGAHGQHRGHVGREHGGPLGHPADREAVARHDHLLGHGVGGHDGRGGLGPGHRPGAARHRRSARSPGLDRVDRERDADQAGLADEDLVGRAAEAAGHGEHRAAPPRVRPGAPVAALALPDVRRTPAARPPVAARWARLTWTGAAAARLVVNTPAAGTAQTVGGGDDGDVERIGGLDAGGAPDRHETPRRGDAHGYSPASGRPDGLGQPQGDVGALDGLARRTLDQVVEGTQDHHPPGAGVDARRDVCGVRPRRGLGRRAGRR